MSEGSTVLRVAPVRLRRICAVVAAIVLVVFVVGAVLLPKVSTGAAFRGVADQLGLAGIGVLAAYGILMLSRSTLEADPTGLRVHNIVGRKDVPWSVVRAVSFRDRSPWATLDLVDDETVPLLAVMAADGDRTIRVVRELRRMLALYGPGSAQSDPNSAG